MVSDDMPQPIEIESLEKKPDRGPFWESVFILRNRVLAGFVVALPVIITFMIVKWLYDFLAKDVIGYTAQWLAQQPLATGNKDVDDVVQASWFVEYILAPVTAITLIVGALFMLGMVFRSRWHRFFNWFMSNVPGVGLIYRSVSNVVESIRQSNSSTQNFQRVVLVKFPHPGIKVPAFVTSTTTDSNTGKEILCIYVPTTPIPTSGYMLMVPADEVTEISWGLQETLQAIVSGGITVPSTVEYTVGVVDPKKVPKSLVPPIVSGNVQEAASPEASPKNAAGGDNAAAGENGVAGQERSAPTSD